MPQCSGTQLMTRLAQHATLSESGFIKACSYTRDNPSSLIVAFHYFTYDSLKRACPNDVTCMDPLIVECHMDMPKSIRTVGLMGIQDATISDQGCVSGIRACLYRTRFT